jgi:hypothetical protein
VGRRELVRLAAAVPLLGTMPAVRWGDGAAPALRPPDEHGLMLLPGFSAREVARAGEPVAGTRHEWHLFPDGGATFPAPDGGWVYVSNSEVPGGAGGAGAVRFAADGRVVDAYPILEATSLNCAGGATPWGTWLSCEEHADGQVWECDPFGERPAAPRPAMGVFTHEAVAADPAQRCLYMTEDAASGRLYRFTPRRWGTLDAGELEVAVEGADGVVDWTRDLGAGTVYAGGEGIAWHDGRVVFTTKSDQRLRELDVATRRVRVLHGPGDDPPIVGPDNVVFSPAGDLLVCEDDPTEQDLVLVAPDGGVRPIARLVGHSGSELAGVALDPSGTRCYVSSQRGHGAGVTYEVTGPFRRTVASTTTATATTAAREGGGAARPTGERDGDGAGGAVVGGGAAVVALALGGMAWLRRRRGTARA